MDSEGDQMRIPSEEDIQPVLQNLLGTCDFEQTTLKLIMEKLADQLEVDKDTLKPRKKYIRAQVEQYMENNYKPDEDDKERRQRAKSEPKFEHDDDAAESEEESDSEQEGATTTPKSKKRKQTGPKYGTKGTKVRLTNFERAVVLGPKLAEFFGVRVLQRTHTTKRINEYVKQHNLQDEADRRTIKCDEALQKLLGVKSCTFFEVTKLIAPLLMKRTDVDDKELQELCEQCDEEALKEKQRIYDEKVANGEPVGKGSVRASKKARRASTDANGEKPKRKMPDYKLSDQLADICGGDVMPRAQVVKELWAYIKKNGLSNGGRIRTDEKLRNLCDGVEEMKNFDINRYISQHLTKI